MKRTLINMLTLVLAAAMILGCAVPSVKAAANNELTFIHATEGVSSAEGGEMLFDGNAATKWCVSGFEGAAALWTMDEPVNPERYVMVTANDSAANKGRNPRAWALMAANGEEIPDDIDSWEIISLVEEDWQMEDVNSEAYYYDIEDRGMMYQHYMLIVVQTQGADTLQLGEFFLEYDGCEYTGNAAALNYEDVEPTGNFSSAYITDGGEYTIAVGDSFTMYHPRTPTSPYYAYTWIVESGEDCLVMDRGQGTCNVIAVKPGTVKLMANLDYTVLCGSWCESYSYEYEVTIHIVDSGNYDHGDVTDGLCPRCHGTGKIDCTACYGDGKFSSGAACTGCDNGKVTCNHCYGTGRWK